MTEAKPVPVILVDDDPDEHFLFKADLEDAGVDFEFNGFTRPEDAMEHLNARASAPVLVLCDLSLAGGDALAFIRDTQARLGGGAIGVYSGARNPEMEEKCRSAGAMFYIVKPVSRAKLVDALAKSGKLSLAEQGNGRVILVAG
ncbi:response regulator [Maricaulis sp. W15]|uniref:response regulator n=1 Tax=Maricaulis sp. W15 TaxID=1772333 RepID=UPI000948FB46|nr:response regulator [Maricaulis sp. W15]